MMPPCCDHRPQEEFVVVLLQEGSGRYPVGAVRSHKAPHSLDEPFDVKELGRSHVHDPAQIRRGTAVPILRLPSSQP